MKTLNQVIPDWMNNGFISALAKTEKAPWGNDPSFSNSLDLEYHGNFSGDKPISPLVYKMLTDEVLTTDSMVGLATLCVNLYSNEWERLWDVRQSEFNPIENYKMIESGNDTETIGYGKKTTETRNLSHGKTGTDSREPNLTETTTPDLTETTTPNTSVNSEDSIYGFNSTSPVPSSTRSETESGANTKTQTGVNTRKETGTDTTTYNTTETDTGTTNSQDSGEDTRTTTHQFTRSGNIGVTTSQQMLQSSIDLWKWNYFRDVIFPDVDRILTLPIY